MKRITFRFSIFILLSIGSIYASEIDSVISRAPVIAHRIENNIKIDGVLSESIWQEYSPVRDFVQKDPDQGNPATQQTYVWICYDDEAIYIGAKCFDDNPDSIATLLSRRDDISGSDWFGIYFDPYRKGKTGYQFFVNAGGSRVDATLYNDVYYDTKWDGVWDWDAAILDDGWSVEMRIPFSQLRFNNISEMVWGINFYRRIHRNNERSYYVMVPKESSGFVSHFAPLKGLKNIPSQSNLEFLSYLVTKAQYLKHDINDPFYKADQYALSFGADFKLGIGSNLTLDATVNPDFGQVEVDPAVVNLTQFETFYSEKRPFFIEGTDLLDFGYIGANRNWSFGWQIPELFYSRRIGRSPQLGTSHDGFVDYPNETRILGASKLTGKIFEGTGIYALNAVTQRMFADVDSAGVRFSDEVEPLTNYTVIRTLSEFNGGMNALGFMGTAVFRDLNNPAGLSNLSESAFTGGFDGYTFLSDDKEYVLNGVFSASRVTGSNDYMLRLQKSPRRYFQRPDSDYSSLDSNATSLTGYFGKVMLNKQKGNFYFNTAFSFITPGYEANDIGYQYYANGIKGHVMLGWRDYKPDGLFRYKYFYAGHYRGADFEGRPNDIGFYTSTSLTFMNYWNVNLMYYFESEYFDWRRTRGGPAMLIPSYHRAFLFFSSDSREDIYTYCNVGFLVNEVNDYVYEASLGVQWKAGTTLNIDCNIEYAFKYDSDQWVTRKQDPVMEETYGTRYIFGLIQQDILSATLRADWSFSPTLTLQLYMQPLFSFGDYSDFNELSQPGTRNFSVYGRDNNSTITYDEDTDTYTIDPDGSGAAEKFTISNPNFNFKSLRANVVLRWEFLPGSTFYLAWTHERINQENPDQFDFGRDFSNLISAEPDNVFLAKVTYWFTM